MQSYTNFFTDTFSCFAPETSLISNFGVTRLKIEISIPPSPPFEGGMNAPFLRGLGDRLLLRYAPNINCAITSPAN
ncbi:MAG: hypothetical protein CLLPBCKN_001906 [Chroococcidiopsis cubana SAG 39.79]|nr:hypothetical protein [Chroococcidiopsis cubana SAG 39.79]